MPHSPYTQTVYPPISDLSQYRQVISFYRADYERGTRNPDALAVLDIGDKLVGQCNFLDEKLTIKACTWLYVNFRELCMVYSLIEHLQKLQNARLATERDTLAKEKKMVVEEKEELKEELKAKEAKIADLKSELEKLKREAATG